MAGADPRWRGFAGAAGQAVSLTLASATALSLTAAPFLIGDMTPAAQTIVPLTLMGMSASFVHGLGMQARSRVWRLVFSPLVGWPLTIGGWAALLAAR